MALTTGEMSPADIAAVTRGNENNFGLGSDGAWWIIILFLFAFMGNGWGNNAGYGGVQPYIAQYNTGNEVQRGFDQASVMNGLNNISIGMTNGFADVSQALCSGFAGVELGANARQMANMQQAFAAQTVFTNQLNTLSVNQQNGVRDIITSQNAGVKAILDKMCQQELDAERRENDNLRTQLNMMNLAASQNAQTAQILADNAAQTQALEQYLNPVPIPAYQVANPNCCSNVNNCGCGSF